MCAEKSATTDRLITSQMLADKLNKSRSTVQRQRTSGTGPSYLRVNGSILYRESDVDLWLDRHRQISTEALVEEQEKPAPPEAEQSTPHDGERWWEKRRGDGGDQ